MRENKYPQPNLRRTRYGEVPRLYAPRIKHPILRTSHIVRACDLWNTLPLEVAENYHSKAFNKKVTKYLMLRDHTKHEQAGNNEEEDLEDLENPRN